MFREVLEKHRLVEGAELYLKQNSMASYFYRLLQVGKRKTLRIVLVPIFCSLSFLVVFGYAITKGFSHNQQARQTLHSCINSESSPNFNPDEYDSNLWWQGIHADCEGDSDRALTIWVQYLHESDKRLDTIRARYRENMTLAEAAADRPQAKAIAFFWLGDATLAQGDDLAAVAIYQEGLALEPENGLIWRQIGDLIQANSGDVATAIYAYDQACFYVDQGKNGCLRAAELYMTQQNFDLAIARYHTSLQQLPNFQPARLGLARALIGKGDIEQAREYLEQLAGEDNQEAANLLATLDN